MEMETNKTILMREVVSIGEKKTIGAVKDIIIDCDSTAVSHFVVTDFDNGMPRLLPYREIRAVGNTFVTINKEAAFLDRDSRPSKELFENGFKLVGIEVFSGDGDKLGTVSGYKFDPSNGKVVSITMNNDIEYSEQNVLFFSPKYVFVEASLADVELKGNYKSVENTSYPQAKTEEVAKESAPQLSEEEESLRELLIGKKVTEQVKSDDGLFLLEKNATVTEEVFRDAAKRGALLMLISSIDA